MIEVIYTWPDGREEVRYRRQIGTREAADLERQVAYLKELHGPQCCYSIRYPARGSPPFPEVEAAVGVSNGPDVRRAPTVDAQ